MRVLVTALVLVTTLSGTADSRRARWTDPRALDGLEERCRSVGAWLAERRTWFDDLALWKQRSSLLAGWTSAALAGADALLAVIDPGGRLPRIDLFPYRMMTVQPVAGRRSSGFGFRDHPVLRRRMLHKGVDFIGDVGTPVRAAAPGMVVRASRWDTYGNIVVIDHGMGVESRYAHLSKIRVREGDFVAAGARVGDVGATGRVTGAHLHFEVRWQGEPMDPVVAFLDR